ncbi:MAG: DciA family protein [Armatimonadota bacterium]|nr:DUF721 domain-containing protein [Armatimonadota bacterium]MDW8155659.1 DciA family protein [Armatimonadota bacterium]
MKSVRELLERVVPGSVAEAARVLRAWARVADQEGLRAEADYRAGQLTLYARSHAQAQELVLHTTRIKSLVNQQAGAPLVREVRVLCRPAGG